MANIVSTTIALGNKAYTTPYNSVGKETCQNLYLELSKNENSKAQYYLLKIPGMKRFGDIDENNLGACRGLFTTSSGRTFGAWGNTFAEIDKAGNKLVRGSLISFHGQVQMAENGALLMLVDGKAGYIFEYAKNSLDRITDEYFPGNADGTKAPTHVSYNDLRFIINVPNTNKYYYSTPSYGREHDDTTTAYDPAEPNGYWSPIYSGMKFGQADNITGLTCAQNLVWLFGINTCEIHYDTGNFNGQLYARYEGAILNVGCSAPKSISYLANSVFWLGSDHSGLVGVFTNNGLQPQRISPRGIEQMIEQMTDYTDAIGFTFSHNGHSFYTLQFPKGNKTFVYDLVTDSWHERTHLNRHVGLLEMHHGLYATKNFDKLIVGDIGHSTVFEFRADYYLNDDPDSTAVNYIRCIKTSPILFSNGNLVRYNSMQVIFQQGVGLSVDTTFDNAIEPKAWVAWSDDAGMTWTSETDVPMGAQGEYTKRSRLLTGGMSRNRMWRIAVTAPVQVILVGIIVDQLVCRF